MHQNHPLNGWMRMSKKKKVKYMECMKQLYGDKHAKEGNVQVKDTNTNRKDRTDQIMCLAKEE